MTKRFEIQVHAGTRRTRLEDFLFASFSTLSRMYLRELVREGKCEVNGRNENVGFRVRGGDLIEIDIDHSRGTSMLPEPIPLNIVFEDAYLIVLNKPAGMLVHPTNRDKRGTLLNALVFHLNAKSLGIADSGLRIADFESLEFPQKDVSITGDNARTSKSAIRNPLSAIVRPGLVHRLDKDTSGLIVVAKAIDVHRKLARQFQKKLVEKKYLALADGVVGENEGQIEGTIGRHADRKRWELKHDGKHSVTRFRVLERRADTTLIELQPVTGRTNQLRIHCASIGHPIVGDVGRGGTEFERLCLHAWRLGFRHPMDGSGLVFEALPDRGF